MCASYAFSCIQDNAGKIIYAGVEEIVEPTNTVLVVWDVQNILLTVFLIKNNL